VFDKEFNFIDIFVIFMIFKFNWRYDAWIFNAIINLLLYEYFLRSSNTKLKG